MMDKWLHLKEEWGVYGPPSSSLRCGFCYLECFFNRFGMLWVMPRLVGLFDCQCSLGRSRSATVWKIVPMCLFRCYGGKKMIDTLRMAPVVGGNNIFVLQNFVSLDGGVCASYVNQFQRFSCSFCYFYLGNSFCILLVYLEALYTFNETGLLLIKKIVSRCSHMNLLLYFSIKKT